jgi:flagella basal body P-ring formation protein FlgA
MRALLLRLLLLAAPVLALPAIAQALPLPAGQPLSAGLAEQLLLPELPPADGDRRWSLTFASPRLPLPNPAAGEAEMTVEGWQHEPRSGRFTAVVRVDLPTGESGRVMLQGRAEEQVRMPVLGRPVGKGDSIAEVDVTESWLPVARLPEDVVSDREDLVGQEAVRRLSPGRTLRMADLRSPRLVRKGDPVTLVYRSGSLELITAGTSLADAGLGEAVEVLNPSGKRAVRGQVAGVRQVTVGPAPEAMP